MAALESLIAAAICEASVFVFASAPHVRSAALTRAKAIAAAVARHRIRKLSNPALNLTRLGARRFMNNEQNYLAQAGQVSFALDCIACSNSLGIC